jgi:hypothetical protein
MSNLIISPQGQTSVFDSDKFEHSQRIAIMLSKSELIPKEYQGKPQNVLIAMELAGRVNASPIMIMQNMTPINGRPSWSSQYIISAINTCGKFEPLRFKIEKKGKTEVIATFWENKQPKQKAVEYEEIICTAYTKDSNGIELEGPSVSVSMAIAEGWYSRTGSKWQTMPELMLRYRAASFFGRLYCPEILMGMQSTEEILDTPRTIETDYTDVSETASPLAKIISQVKKAPTPTPSEIEETKTEETEGDKPETEETETEFL